MHVCGHVHVSVSADVRMSTCRDTQHPPPPWCLCCDGEWGVGIIHLSCCHKRTIVGFVGAGSEPSPNTLHAAQEKGESIQISCNIATEKPVLCKMIAS